MLIFDAHLDLSFNALQFNRDLRLRVAEVRRAENGLQDLPGRGRNTVCFPEMRQAGIGVCVATQLAGCMKPAGPGGGWNSPEQAWAITQGQLAWYQAMEQAGELRQLRSRSELDAHLTQWNLDSEQTPIGYILSLEGADSIRDFSDLQRAYELGLRALGPAHYGVGRYALGHDQRGGLTTSGRELLSEMDQLGLILDMTHLSEDSFWQALDVYRGPLWASHHNCRALVDDPRQLNDEQIRALAQRGGVMGIAFDIWMAVPNWVRGQSHHGTIPNATMAALADHIDHVCQLLGNAQHVGIGTDLDGGFGTEQSPADLDSIADVPILLQTLEQRGYPAEDVQRIAHGNFLDFLMRNWL